MMPGAPEARKYGKPGRPRGRPGLAASILGHPGASFLGASHPYQPKLPRPQGGTDLDDQIGTAFNAH
jgi:hypothetical protein